MDAGKTFRITVKYETPIFVHVKVQPQGAAGKAITYAVFVNFQRNRPQRAAFNCRIAAEKPDLTPNQVKAAVFVDDELHAISPSGSLLFFSFIIKGVPCLCTRHFQTKRWHFLTSCDILLL